MKKLADTLTFDLYDVFGENETSIPNLISAFEAFIEHIVQHPHYKEAFTMCNVEIELDLCQLVIRHYRDETPREAEQRKARLAKQREKKKKLRETIKQRELKELERLKKKYES